MRPIANTRRWPAPAAVTCLAALLVAVPITGGAEPAYAGQGASAYPAKIADKRPDAQRPSACKPPSSPVPLPVTATTIDAIEQAYYCVFDHYVGGSTLDDEPLLTAAFAGFVQDLDKHGLDRSDARMPRLTGDRARDWAALEAVYRRVTRRLPADPTLRQSLAAATMNGMLAGLHNNHARWMYQVAPPGDGPGKAYGLGLETSPWTAFASVAPKEVHPPLFVSEVLGGSAAAQQLRPGDIIEAVDGAPPFVDGIPSEGAMNLLSQEYPRSKAVRVRLHRPATGRTWTVVMQPQLYDPLPGAGEPVTAKRMAGDIAHVRLTGFFNGASAKVRKAITDMAHDRPLRGVILDLRENGGGSPAEVGKLLGAFTHGKIWSYDCDVDGSCKGNYTDDSVPLLKLPLVVLTARNCASACDAFAGAVQDLHLGRLVGTRTAGVVAGKAEAYVLSDNSILNLPARHEQGADREIINGIGVPPDYYIPLTAQNLSNGKDPAADKAVHLLAD